MQTTYTTIPDVAFRGMLADVGNIDVVSKSFKALAGAAAPFGTPMFTVVGDVNQCRLPADDDDVFLGVAVHRMIAPGTTGSNAFTGEQGIEDTQTVDVLRRGRVWVKVEEAVTPQDPVYARCETNGLLVPGNWGKSIDGDKCQLVANARWCTSAAAGELVELEVNPSPLPV